MWIPQPPQSVEKGRSKAGRESADATDELIDSSMKTLKVHPDEREAAKETLRRREGVRVTTTDIKQHESNATARPMLILSASTRASSRSSGELSMIRLS